MFRVISRCCWRALECGGALPHLCPRCGKAPRWMPLARQVWPDGGQPRGPMLPDADFLRSLRIRPDPDITGRP